MARSALPHHGARQHDGGRDQSRWGPLNALSVNLPLPQQQLPVACSRRPLHVPDDFIHPSAEPDDPRRSGWVALQNRSRISRLNVHATHSRPAGPADHERHGDVHRHLIFVVRSLQQPSPCASAERIERSVPLPVRSRADEQCIRPSSSDSCDVMRSVPRVQRGAGKRPKSRSSSCTLLHRLDLGGVADTDQGCVIGRAARSHNSE